MPRKKNASSKNNSANATLKLIQEIEMDLFAVPADLVDQLDKEISALSAKSDKLKASISKLAAQADKKAKSNNKAAKKVAAKLTKEIAALTKQLDQMGELIDSLKAKKSKFAALRKHLGQFEKDWSKQVKEATKIAKAKKATKVKAKKAKKPSNSAKDNAVVDLFDSSTDASEQDQELDNTGT